MKRDIRQLNFRSIAGWRGDSLVCPQAFGGDIYAGCSMGCWWCFIREMEEEMFSKYYTGWSRELVRPCDPEDFRRLFDRAFGSDKGNDWILRCLREGLPFNMGSKAETFCVEDLDHRITEKVLAIFQEYDVPLILETKSHYVGLRRYVDILREMKVAVIVAIMGGSDTLNYKLEPNAPSPTMRWQLVEALNRVGIWTAVRWEPIMAGINSKPEMFEDYAKLAKKHGAKHVSFFNYRTSNYKIAMREFEARGYNYPKMLEGNLDENWRPTGRIFKEAMDRHGVLSSSPDVINFPFDSDRISCCGVDSLFKSYKFTLQYACHLIKERGHVKWDDMEEVAFKEPGAYERLKKWWNGGGQYYMLSDSPEIVVLDREKGKNVYGRRDPTKKKGLFW